MPDNEKRVTATRVEGKVRASCPDCGVGIGKLHEAGCDVERCPDCGRQAISCDCGGAFIHPRLPWSGHWPGDLECREFGWWARLVAGRGWVSCDATDPGARPDLNRLAVDAEWDANAGRFVEKTNAKGQGT